MTFPLPTPMNRSRSATLLFLLFAIPMAAKAQHWSCWYEPSRENVVICERDLEPAVARNAAFRPAAAPSGPVWESRPARRFRAIDERVMIPLHAKPADLSRLPFLARDVLCGRLPRCDVEFSGAHLHRAGTD